MDDLTIRQLNAINREFYARVADSFDKTRQQAWSGWEQILPYLADLLKPARVLDVGCGNGRFGRFLADHTAIAYHGIDNNQTLLERARIALDNFDPVLELRDIVENPPDSGSYDLIAVFGMLHHIPSADRRRQLMGKLAQGVADGGLLAFACWRFYEIERYRKRIVPWPSGWQVEPNDYLLDWQRDVPPGRTALRYCHYVDDAEHAELIAASGLEEVITYRADGYTNDANCYTILRRNE